MPNRRIPSLNWLRVFEAAARCESFTRAGMALNMSAAAVSQQIKALETHLGAPLFERGPRSVTLTESGRAFLPVVRQSLLSVETTAASLFGHARHKPVTVRTPLIFATSWLARHLPEFQARHPDIQVHVAGDDDDSGFGPDGVDLVVTYGGTPVSDGDSAELFGETIYPIASPDLASAIGGPESLLNHTLIEISAHRTSWLSLFEAAGISDLSDARFCFTNATTVAISLARAGHGIALARAPASDFLETAMGLVRCLNAIEVRSGLAYYVVSRGTDSLSPAAAAFRSWLLETTAQLR